MIAKILLLGGFLVAGSCFGATFTGKISDSACGASHAKMKAEHSNIKSDRDCTLACVKAGSKYVLVSGGKVYDIENQNFPGLEEYAGDNVRMTGDLKGNTITVAKIEKGK
jgi:hypothetical protein